MSDSQSSISSPESVEREAARVVRFQSLVSLALIGLFLLLFLAGDWASHTPWVSDAFDRRELALNSDGLGYYVQRGAFFDEVDYLWYHILDTADYSRGGVYLLGSSNAMHCLNEWTLPREQAAVIHNYGFAGANPREMTQFVRYLIDRRGLLAAGPGKQMFIFGFSFYDVEGGGIENYFPAGVARGGIYRYDPEEGIVNLPLSPAMQFFNVERARTRSVALRVLLGQRHIPANTLNVPEFRQHVLERMSPQWQTDLPIQIREISRLLDDLSQSHVQMLGVLLPVGSWGADIPVRTAYEDQLRQVFAAHSLPLLDCTAVVPDTEFCDPYHVNARGAVRIQKILDDQAMEFVGEQKLLLPVAK
jgi:hypothetical protein